VQIKTRLTIQFTLLVSAIVLLSFFLVYYFTEQLIEREFGKRLYEKAITSAVLLIKVNRIDSALLSTIDRAKRDNLYRENIMILDSAERVIYTNRDSLEFAIPPRLFSDVQRQREIRFHQREFTVTGLLFHDRATPYVIIAGAENREGEQRLADLRTLLITLFVVLIIVVALTGRIYAGRALKPMQKVMLEAERISPTNLAQRLQPLPLTDEIGKLVAIFNNMLARIENAFSLQKTFVANVSHELKNPLTKITSQLEVTLLKDRTDHEYRETIRSVLDDIKEINQLSNTLLELARLNRGENMFALEMIRMDEIVWDVRDNIDSLQMGYKVEVDVSRLPEDENDLVVAGNAHLLRTALFNVVENGCKFADNKTARVIIGCTASHVQLEVTDAGPGISADDLPHIFEPFYRADATAKTKGYGIGLSLSQRIVSIHKGTIILESQPGVGSRVHLAFPKAKES
jgi:signal transduction histidine kinase